jgi:NhaP-type Na+/H+ and K+/H+ antiporter
LIKLRNINFELNPSGHLSQEFLKKGISNFNDAMNFVKNLPYGRNQNREDFSLVLKENKGTCSSKHALLKVLADENSRSEVKLMLGIFKMNAKTYPKIQKTLQKNDLEYLPEAHNYLKIENQIFDCTNSKSSEKDFLPYLISEREIEAKEVIEGKIQIHQDFLKKWSAENELDFDKIWEVREECIKNLSS